MNNRLRECTSIQERQFGFTPDRSTTHAIFGLKQTVERHIEDQKEINLVFTDLEKPMTVVLGRKCGDAQKNNRECEKTRMRSSSGESSNFQVDVELHQGSVLSPFLFIMVMYVLIVKMRKEVPESSSSFFFSSSFPTFMWGRCVL